MTTLKMLYDALICDLDGVLQEAEHVNVKAIVETMAARQFVLSPAELAMIPGRSSFDMIPLFLKNRCVPESEHFPIIQENRARYDQLWGKEVRLMPEAEETLKKLRERNIPLAIGTTNRRMVVDRFLHRFGFQDFFSIIVASEDVKKKKPDPEVYLLAAERLGARRILVAEDTEVGVQAAKSANLSCAAIPNELSRLQNFSQADYVLNSLRDLLPLVGVA